MTFLVELPKEAYPANALDGFEVRSDFKLENAQAMMWLSQLAYETADKGKIDDLLKGWKLTRRAFGSNAPATGLPPKSACFVVAGGRDATVVTFSGTDPLKIQDWITDFTVQAKLDVLHQGFSDAVETVWPTIKSAIEGRPELGEKPLLYWTQSWWRTGAHRGRACHARVGNSGERCLYIRRSANRRPDLLRPIYAGPWRPHVPPRAWRRHRPNCSAQCKGQLSPCRATAPLFARFGF